MPDKPDHALVRNWLTARSIARGLPLPVDDRGGWRVDTDGAEEKRRHVFMGVGAGLRDIAHATEQPGIFVKLCGTAEDLRAALPPRWTVTGDGWFMTCDPATARPPILPAGYRLEVETHGPVTRAKVLTDAGALAASGHAASANNVYVYDQIVTQPAHGRRGLGAAIMGALQAARAPTDTQQALVATDQGRQLYARLGWEVRSPWATAFVAHAR